MTRSTWAASSWSAEPRQSTKSAPSASVSLSSNLPIIVAGPTAVGKTLLAAELAHQFGGEIVGADAYQVYEGLAVLTSQPDAETRVRVPHHLFGFLPVSEPFDAARFVQLARETMDEIAARGKIPVICGGSGLYIKALTHGIADLPAPDPALRQELDALPLEVLRERLEKADPAAAASIDLKNPRRVVRALEIFLLTGRSAADLRQGWKNPDAPGFRGIILERERGELEARIRATVDAMFARGAVDEVRALGPVGPTAQMTIGLREIQALLRGEMTETECKEAMVLSTRQYAKRQSTWFRNQFSFPRIDLTGSLPVSESLLLARQALGASA
ncbi:tRNA (adenosine(37)-N6)-dimethylallyltransferase MiaA [Spartobacteria bacterium LR76]|nr:tRNA (adenosine(37)-N6)-dimethylallyltransferase MiaA [Spartobacteria bacterium LR76]